MTRWLAQPKFDGFWRLSSIRASGSTSGSTAGCWRSSRRKRWARTARSLASTKLWPLGASRTPLLAPLPASPARQNPAEARPSRSRSRRGSVSDCNRHSEGARRAQPRLQAALSLAKLYQSTGRPADAHAVLALALEGFAPTPEMPEIAEAQAMLAALSETDEVEARGGSEPAPAASPNSLWPSDDVGQGLRRRGDQDCLRARDGARGDDRQLFRALRGGPLPMDHGLRARRVAVGAGAGIGLPEGSGRCRAPCGGCRRPTRPRAGLLPGRRFRRGADPLRAGARDLRPRPRPGDAGALQRRHPVRREALPRRDYVATGRSRSCARTDRQANKRGAEIGHAPSMAHPLY